MVDSKGLITTSRGDKLPSHKKQMARSDDTPNMKDLREIVEYVKPHALIGLSGAGPMFKQARPRHAMATASSGHLLGDQRKGPCVRLITVPSCRVSARFPPQGAGPCAMGRGTCTVWVRHATKVASTVRGTSVPGTFCCTARVPAIGS